MKLVAPLARAAPPDRAAWDALLGASRGVSVFHTASWAELWTAEWRDARWEAIVLEDGNGYTGAIGAIVRRRGVARAVYSMPYGTYGGPIVREDHPDPASARRLLFEGYARLAGGRLSLRSELTWYEGALDELPAGLRPQEAFTHVLPLGRDYEAVAGGFAPATRRLVRQAEESGLAIRAAETLDDVRFFYDLAVETARRRGGRPKPHSLYVRIFERLVPAGVARYHLVLHGDRPVAGSLHLFHEGVATNWLPVSTEAAWNLRPNNFLISRVLKSLCAAGYLEYQFGASPLDAAGLIRFKEGWGAKQRPLVIAGSRSALHQRLRV